LVRCSAIAAAARIGVHGCTRSYATLPPRPHSGAAASPPPG